MDDDAEYMRAQSAFFLSLAQQMSDPKDQEHFKTKAMSLVSKAERLEERALRTEQDIAIRQWKGESK